jgi:hypothetical protein
MENTVYIQTNHKQIVGAIVAEYAFRRNSAHNDKFDVKIVNVNDFPYFAAHEGKKYLRGKTWRPWLNNDLQSFTLTRFMPPELSGFKGRSVVVDPDVFPVTDVWPLFERDMKGKAILARPRSRSGKQSKLNYCSATSVMVLDHSKLTHWNIEQQFEDMFRGKRDYKDWVCLRTEDPDTIGPLETEWNDLDVLTAKTRMLHTTKRKTQPWKTGLPIDFRPAEPTNIPLNPAMIYHRSRRKIGEAMGKTEYFGLGHYKQNPDLNQERFFFGLVKECVEKGIISEDQLREQMKLNHVRHDAFEIIERLEPLAPFPEPPMPLPAG